MPKQNHNKTGNLKGPADYHCFWICGVDTVYTCDVSTRSLMLVFLTVPTKLQTAVYSDANYKVAENSKWAPIINGTVSSS